MSLTASSPLSSKTSAASRTDKLRLDAAENKKAETLRDFGLFVFGLVADITPQVEHASAKTNQSGNLLRGLSKPRNY